MKFIDFIIFILFATLDCFYIIPKKGRKLFTKCKNKKCCNGDYCKYWHCSVQDEIIFLY